MQRALKSLPQVGLFLVGAAVGALSVNKRLRMAADDSALRKDLEGSLAALERRLESQESAAASRFTEMETRLEEHAAKLSDVPSTTQIVAAMERLLSKALSSLDERLATQARSIEVLKTTVSQSDGLLERVLEALDTLQTEATRELNEGSKISLRSS